MINKLELLEDVNIKAESDGHEPYDNECINACFEAIDASAQEYVSSISNRIIKRDDLKHLSEEYRQTFASMATVIYKQGYLDALLALMDAMDAEMSKNNK